MSDYLRLPVEKGVVRVKYASAEWTKKRDKLVLKGPIDYYCESDAQESGKGTAEEIVMLDASVITKPITNPIRLMLLWGEVKGQPPVVTHAAPPEGAEAVTPAESTFQGSGGGGGWGGGKKKKQTMKTREQLDEAIAYTVAAMGEPGVKESGLTADKILGCAMFVEWGSKPAAAAASAPAAVDVGDIPFSQLAPTACIL